MQQRMISITEKRRVHFEQLMAYLEAYEESGCYYGNKEQFDKRHEELKDWLRGIIQTMQR